MAKLVDTTIRLLSQEPLAGALPTAEVLRVAEILDQAGFACLEVSGGGVFDATVRRRVESPWERIRGIKSRVSTPLGIALRGRFLVGSRPVSGDIVGRFVSCAAENGIEVFRLHDPLNDVSNLRELLRPLRETQLGEQVVQEVKRVRLAAAQTTLFRPWTVEQLVPLR